MPLKASDALIDDLLAPYLTRADGEVHYVYGLHEPYDDWIMYWFFGPLLRFLLLKQLILVVTERRLLLMEISAFYQEKDCEALEFDEVEQVRVDERSIWGHPFSIVRFKTRDGDSYHVTIRLKHPGITRHEEHYRKVIAGCKSLAADAGARCPQCGAWVGPKVRACRSCKHRFTGQEVAEAEQQAEARVALHTEQARRAELQRAKKWRRIVGWSLVVLGVLAELVIVLGMLVPAPAGQTRPAFLLLPVLGGSICLLSTFLAPGLLLLTWARKIERTLATLPATASASAPAGPSITEGEVLRITCPHCRRTLRFKASAAGKRARCPNAACGAVIAIPQTGPIGQP
jgi:hypothetical protein